MTKIIDMDAKRRERDCGMSSDREDVAIFAAWSVGSGFGDGDPKVGTEYDAVLRDEAVYAEWKRRLEDYERQKAESGMAFCNATPKLRKTEANP